MKGRMVVRRIVCHSTGISVGTRAMTSTGGPQVVTPGTDRVVSGKEGERTRLPIATDPTGGCQHRSVTTRIQPRIPVSLQPDRPSPGSNRSPPRQP